MLLRLDRQTLGYGSASVLSEVSLTLAPGDRVVLLGRSGAGKTTLLNAAFDGLTAAEERVALVPQDLGLVPQLSVLRNVLMGRLDDHGALHNIRSFVRPRAADRARITAHLADLGLGDLPDRPVGALSGGQRQRVALARALDRGGVLVADEPVSALDAARADTVMTLLGDRFATMLLTLHDTDMARRIATRLVGLKGGRVAFDAPPEAVTDTMLAALYG